jgi:pimeloyl-ACP methyl ester carboxylesterase
MKKCLVLFAWFCVAAAQAAAPVQLLDDREITIRSVFDVGAKRQALIKYIWGADGFPSRRLPDIVVTNVPSPVKMLADLARVDEFRLNMAPGLQGLAYHFIAQRPNGELVVLHHGHGCTFDDEPGPKDVGFGLQRTIAALLREGYGVLGVFMPHKRPGDCAGGHDAMFQMTGVVGSPMRFFLETAATGLNYLKQRYRAFHMVGLSGGGWTTTVYAAIDPRIQYSFPVAGTIPLYLRVGGSVGDREQYESTFYRIAGYPDLYILGAHGKGRKQVQILVRRDNCCFGERQHDEKAIGKPYAEAMREYEQRVRNAVGSFRLVIDEVGPSHMISHHAIEDVILPELQSARR